MIYRVIIFILLFVVSVDAQIRRLVIDDFSGGINQAAPSQVQPNQCYDMVNFDLTVSGALTPMPAFRYFDLAEDSTAGNSIQALTPYGFIGNRHLLIQRTSKLNHMRIDVLIDAIDGSTQRMHFTIGSDTFQVAWNINSSASLGNYIDTLVAKINAHGTLSSRVTANDSTVFCYIIPDGIWIDSTLNYDSSEVLDGNDDALLFPFHLNDIATKTMTYTMVRSGTEDTVLAQYNALVYSGRPQTGVHSFQWSGKSWIASYGSEMQIFDGERMYPARPLGPEQPRAVAMDNAGYVTGLTGTIRYKYGYWTSIGSDTSYNFSIPSFPVEVYNGAVYVSNMFYRVGANYVLRIYRSIDGGPYYSIITRLTSEFDDGYIMLLDSGVTNIDTTTYPYGGKPRCTSGKDISITAGSPGNGRPPGTLFAAVGSPTPDFYGIAWPDSITAGLTDQMISYATVFVDTLGRRSYMSPPFCVEFRATSTAASDSGRIYVDLSLIPLAPDTNIIVKRIILRSFAKSCDGNCPDADGGLDVDGCYDVGNWYIVDTLYDDDQTTYTDSMPACSLHIPSRFYCEGIEPDVTTLEEHYSYTTADNPEDNCLDSVISFKPTWIIQRGAQAFAIGDPANPNRIYMSTFYDPGVGWTPSTWPLDKYFEIPGNGDDWFVALAILNNDLYGFRQHSIVKISGFTYYQFQVQTISQRVGAISPRSVVATLNHIYFADDDGVYVTGGGQPTRISQSIDSTWKLLYDNTTSPFVDYRRGLLGFTYRGEYWLQTGRLETGTLIFNERNGTWRRWDELYTDIISYNPDTLALDAGPTRIIIAKDDTALYMQDTSYAWSSDPCVYLSRELFGDPAREKIHYIDILGRGRIDSLMIISYREGREEVDVGYSDTTSMVSWGRFTTSAGSVRVRIAIDVIVPSYQFRLIIYPDAFGEPVDDLAGGWAITSIVIGWQPWDEGRPR